MSERFGHKVKENAGKTKYSTLNLNQTYKGTKLETKTSSGKFVARSVCVSSVGLLYSVFIAVLFSREKCWQLSELDFYEEILANCFRWLSFL